MTDDIAAQVGGFEYDNTQQLERVENKIDAIAKAVGVPAPEVKAEPWQPMPVLEEVAAAALPPAAPAEAPEGKAPGLVSTVAHKVVDMAEGAVDAVRSLAAPRDAEEEVGYSDAEIAAATAHVASTAPHAGVAPVARVAPHAGVAPLVVAEALLPIPPVAAPLAGATPLGPHTLAVADRRMQQPAPSLVAV